MRLSSAHRAQSGPDLGADVVLDALYGEPLPAGAERGGVMLHFDGSRTDRGGIRWLRTATLGYSYAVGDDGLLTELERWDMKTPHAGVCRTPGANSRYYGLCALTDERTPATAPQLERLADVVVRLWRFHFWGVATADAVAERVRGHCEEAVFPRGHVRAGQLGRKCDPIGLPTGPVIISMTEFREEVRRRLAA